MKLISYNHVEPMLKKHFKVNLTGHAKIMSYKRDRYLEISRNNQSFTILEHGYKKQVLDNLDERDFFKTLKKRMKFEFPRSNKLYLKL